MSVIKIPSSKIYKIDTISNSQGNNIKKVELEQNVFSSSVGNVLSESYLITLNERVEGYDVFESAFQFVGYDTSKNKVPFFVSGSTSNCVNEDPLFFKVAKNTNIVTVKKDGYKEDIVTSHYINITENFENVNGETLQFIRKSYAELSYDEETNEFMYYDSRGRYDPSIYPLTGLRINHRRLINGVDWALTTLHISVVGEHISPKTENLSYYSSDISDYRDVSLKLPSNELVQKDTRTYEETDYNFAKAKKVLNLYENGKEVYTLRCSVSDYFDENGMLQISPTNENFPPLFEKYAIVEPYIFTSKGEKPLSTTKYDISIKRFEVIGVDIVFDGAVWQDITIQEYIE